MKAGDPLALLAGLPLPNRGASGSTHVPKQEAQAWQREMERAQAEAWFMGALPTPAAGSGLGPPSARIYPPATSGPGGSTSRAGNEPLRRATGGHSTEPQPQANPDARCGTGPAHRGQLASGEAAQPAIRGQAGAVAGCHAPGAWPIGPCQYTAQDSPAAPSRSPHTALLTARDTSLPSCLVRAGNGLSPSQGCHEEHSDPSHDREALPASVPPARLKPESAVDEQPVRIHVELSSAGPAIWLGVDRSAAAQMPALAQVMARWMAAAGYAPPTWVRNGKEWQPPATSVAAVPATMTAASAPGRINDLKALYFTRRSIP